MTPWLKMHRFLSWSTSFQARLRFAIGKEEGNLEASTNSLWTFINSIRPVSNTPGELDFLTSDIHQLGDHGIYRDSEIACGPVVASFGSLRAARRRRW